MNMNQPIESQYQTAMICQFATIDWSDLSGDLKYGYTLDDPKAFVSDLMLDNRKWLSCDHIRQYLMKRHD